MARKYDLISELYRRTADRVVSSQQSWQRFLSSACRNYKLRFDEQLLVYAQKPEATAVLEIERWNESFGRWVNRGAHGIAVFAEEDRSRQRLKYYFDISDTHPGRGSRTVPVWEMHEGDEPAVMESLEAAFGPFSQNESLSDSITAAAHNVVEDNLPDYLQELLLLRQDSFLEELDELNVGVLYRQAVENSVAFMLMTRLGINSDGFFDAVDFDAVLNFNTPATINSLGFATSDIAEMALTEVARTITAAQRSDANRTFAKTQPIDYNELENKETEMGDRDERDHLHDAGRLQPAEPEPAGTAGGGAGNVRAAAPELPQAEPQSAVLHDDDGLQSDLSSGRDSGESRHNGAEPSADDGEAGRTDGEFQGTAHDGMGSEDEQPSSLGTGDRTGRADFQLTKRAWHDRDTENRSMDFLHSDEDIRDILGTTPHLKVSLDDVREYYLTHPDHDDRTEYIKGIFNDDYTEVLIGEDERRFGYKTYQNVLHLWEGSYTSRTREGWYHWGVIAAYFDAMRLLGTLHSDYKSLPSVEGQISFMQEAEEKTSASFFSQEIIDRVLTRGSNVSEGKMRIYEQFQKSLSAKENIDFLKNEYGIGGSYPVITGLGLNEGHDGKGIALSHGFGTDAPKRMLKWPEVERRIRELISAERYLNPKELAKYPEWLAEQEQRRAAQAEERRNRDILSSAPPAPKEPETEKTYAYHLGDHVYLGAAEYELLSLSDDRVELYDYQYPLFHKELTREEFDAKVRENPMNDHLVVTTQTPAETVPQAEEIPEIPPETAPLLPLAERLAAFGKDYDPYGYWDELPTGGTDEDMVQSMMGQLENKTQTIELVSRLIEMYEEDPPVELKPELRSLIVETNALLPPQEQPLVREAIRAINTYCEATFDSPADTTDLAHVALAYTTTEDGEHTIEVEASLLTCHTITRVDGAVARDEQCANLLDYIGDYLKFLDFDELVYLSEEQLAPFEKEASEPEQLIETNIGHVPVEDYREIIAMQSGFDSYEDMYRQGVRLGDGLDKEPEPLTPAFEKPKRSRTQSFDLHPDIPMADRLQFDLSSHEIEEVGKKERFRRNLEAIHVLNICETEGRFATAEEQLILSKYVGWGGIPEAFDPNNLAWSAEAAALSAALTPEEYASARESTLTAFYTPPVVIDAIYKALGQMGFTEGNLLEPSCGIGHFIGMLPQTMAGSSIYGVEMDTVSAGIAQQLYQRSSIAAMPYEKTAVPDSFFDAVVGNVPFGDFGVSDKRYDKQHFLIHDYFFAKSLDKLRPGGVMALVTSKGTMDKESPAVRKYIAQRADLLGAIRLPNDTFKGNAGTGVVSDILILQKRDRLVDIEPDWVHLGQDSNGIAMNSYFIDHPEMILGEMKMVSGRFGPEPTCVPFENADLAALLAEAVANIHGEIGVYEQDEELDEEEHSIPAAPTVRNFSYTLVDGSIYFRENSRMTPVEASATAESRIKGMIAIRDSVRLLIEMQTEDYPDADIEAEQANLNTLYDTFAAKYGLINSRANSSAFSQDSSFCLLSALEVLGDDGQLERKADMFVKRTIKPHVPVSTVDTPSEALAVCIGERAEVDMEYMTSLCGQSEEEIVSQLSGIIFRNPLYEDGSTTERKYLAADEYLSGNVREKLTVARNAAKLYPDDYTANVTALEAVQPQDLSASEIAVRLGATWLPPEVVQEFIFEFLDTPRYAQWNIKVHYSQFTGEWNIEGKSYDRGNVKAYSTYGTGRINAYKIIEDTLNLRDVRIFDYEEDADGKRHAVLNKKETAIAQAKQEAIKQGFQDWIWTDPSRRELLVRMYNEKFNSIRPREYDGSHIVFSGMNPEISLRPHQVNAIAHIMYGGNTLLAHAVGAGKTYEMVAAAMESKRLGLCTKNMFVVPNHLTEQWASEFLQLYPAANILVATRKDFEARNRKRFCGRIATGDYDAIIIGHSQFEKIPVSLERQRAILEQQLEEITNGIAELRHSRGENFSIKQMERSRKAVKAKLDKLNDQSRKDDLVTFEELGVDRIFIDESHYFKNLAAFTKMRNVSGISQTEAQKSSDLFMKCRYLDEITGGRGIVFATGTPISNSMVELYTIQRYLQYATLQKHGIASFDAWASTFGETVTAIELTPEGTGYRAKTRFARFYNLPELMSMFKEIADIQTADMLNLPVPVANFHTVAVKPSPVQTEMVADLSTRADRVRSGMVDSSVDNMLLITNDGRKLALDQRMMSELLPDFEGSKVNACVENIYRIWQEGADRKTTQLVFCDLSTPKGDGSFSVYNDIRKKLLERGVPADEISFIHEADTETKKQSLFKKVRSGEVRVLMGSTQKMGAGTNVQNHLIALHDIDCPWRPADLEQRSGRIIRQGNENPEVDIFRYVTEQTFDAYLYQLIEGKQKFASQIMTSKSPVRSAEDIDETALSYAEIKMLATGNPYIKEKMDLDIQVQRLRLLKSNYLSERYALEDKILKFYPQDIARRKETIEGLKSDMEIVAKNPRPDAEHFSGMVVKGTSYTEKAEAGQALIDACKEMTSPDPIALGSYRGFSMELSFDTFSREYTVRLKGTLSYSVALGTDPHGNITRLDNTLDGLEKRLTTAVQELENVEKQLETAKADVQKPFSHEEELQSKTARLSELNALLNVDHTENEVVDGEPDEGEDAPSKKAPGRDR